MIETTAQFECADFNRVAIKRKGAERVLTRTVELSKERESKFWDERQTVYVHVRDPDDHNVRLLAIDKITRPT